LTLSIKLLIQTPQIDNISTKIQLKALQQTKIPTVMELPWPKKKPQHSRAVAFTFYRKYQLLYQKV